MPSEAMASPELLTKNFFEANLRNNGNLAFSNTLDFRLDCGE
jgi:hypothetical protein